MKWKDRDRDLYLQSGHLHFENDTTPVVKLTKTLDVRLLTDYVYIITYCTVPLQQFDCDSVI